VSSRPRAKENSREEKSLHGSQDRLDPSGARGRNVGHGAGPATGVHPNTIGNWKQKYSGLESSDLARLKQLEFEHAQMSRIIARQALELEAVRDLISKNGWSHRSAKKP
jgi:hypothetical protein